MLDEHQCALVRAELKPTDQMVWDTMVSLEAKNAFQASDIHTWLRGVAYQSPTLLAHFARTPPADGQLEEPEELTAETMLLLQTMNDSP